MRKQISIVLAAGLLMAGPATALAAGTPSLTLSRQASDMLFLTRSQERRAWNDLHRQAVNQYLPPGFSASVEWALPNTVRIEPVTNKAGRDVPALRPYYFAIVQRKLLIVKSFRPDYRRGDPALAKNFSLATHTLTFRHIATGFVWSSRSSVFARSEDDIAEYRFHEHSQ